MTAIQAIILGAIQGLTEFIPVSSSGHLVAIPHLLGWEYQGKSFDAAVHLGTLFAVVMYFWQDWVRILQSFFAHTFKGVPYSKDDNDGVNGRLLVPIVVACIPAAIVGAKWGDELETLFGSWQYVAAALAVFGIVMLVADKCSKKHRDIGRMGYADYLAIGLAQALAVVFPGTSRSGITITAGLFRGLSRDAAARFSFLLSTPVVFGAGVFAARHIDFAEIPPVSFALGLISSAVFGVFAIRFLISFLKRKPMTAFVVYRLCLAGLLVVLGWHEIAG